MSDCTSKEMCGVEIVARKALAGQLPTPPFPQAPQGWASPEVVI